ncbi:hypothetical protein K461DRAFT_214794, partial [Myriangium duriaei CBS 260.36]
FHTFSATSACTDHSAAQKEGRTTRTIHTIRACGECRRRKIKCDGTWPCGNCKWYKHDEQCKYTARPSRAAQSQQTIRKLSSSLQQSQKVIDQLFPNANVAQLGSLSRQDLLNMLSTDMTDSSAIETASPHTKSHSTTPVCGITEEEDTPDLEALVLQRSPETGWDERNTSPDGTAPVPDDVNALSMSVSHRSSYLGVSSITTSLRVIQAISKSGSVEHAVCANPFRSTGPKHHNLAVDHEDHVSTTIAPSPLGEACLIDAYFSDVHPLIPMIDKARFMVTLETKTRVDEGWLALLNMVLAMGSIAASTAGDRSHVYYYNAVKRYINLDFLGNGNIEVVQALGLMGGLYLHYESRPNMANAVMGAVMRMACALGLHCESDRISAMNEPSSLSKPFLPLQEVRRRTWWSLFCLDTWATTTMGRPSLGRIGSAVTVKPPDWSSARSDDHTIDDDAVLAMILHYEVSFCKIATRIQDRLAELPLLTTDQIAAFDSELTSWQATLPDVLRSGHSCSSTALMPRTIMNWRYNNLRFLLYRPLLLDHALRSYLDPNTKLSEEQLQCAATCREIVTQAITDIRLEWCPTQMFGWHAVWLLFQASMAPLVTLFSAFNRHEPAEMQIAQAEIENVIELLGDMSSYSVAAPKTKYAIERIYGYFR